MSDSLLIVQPLLLHYRKAFFSKLSELEPGLVILSNEHTGPDALTSEDLPGCQIRWVKSWSVGQDWLVYQRSISARCFQAPRLVMTLNPRSISTWFIILARKLARRKTVLWGHAFPRKGPSSRTDRVRGLMRRLADVLLVYTESERSQLAAMYPTKPVFSAPNALYTSAEMVPAPADRPSSTFLYVGRLIESKKPDVLVEAFLKAAEDLPAECRLVIVGDGPLRDSLVAKVQAHEFGSRIDLPGTVTCIKELQRLYANAIAGVSPGYVGLSITQSLGFGVPMIISRNEPHAPEIEAAQDGQNAVFFETDNRDALASTLVDVYRDRERWRDLRESISAQCVRDYSAERMAQGFLEAVKALDDPSA